MIHIRTLDQLPVARNTRVFYRVDYNVPLEGTRITDATRIEETLPTLRALLDKGAAVVIASHLGRPKGQRNDKYSLQPIRAKLSELLGRDVAWASDCVGDEAENAAAQLAAGGVLLVENLRFHAGEEKNDAEFAAQLRKLADVYLNDAFGACHRAHASIDALPRLFPKDHTAGGLLLEKELTFLQKVTNVSERPFVALLGGAKIAGKIEPLEALQKLADKILIGGGMANTFLAARGVPMGGSLVDNDSLDVARRIMEADGAELVLPVDLIVADSLDAPTGVDEVEVSEGFVAEEKAFDIGPQTVKLYEAELKEAKTIFWNGPMGVFEKEEFAKGTMAIAKAVANADAITVVGGGESVEAVKASGFADRITHISTGGGASLEFIAGETLPGVEVLRN
ncbi:MAG: phosphoglycerate kinase [Acidobacteria bacterium]|nr:phosphoglycerate kinase [Acidobacteriota bacterium]MBV9475724.1 phosphoglycerate kinase [Acidobacteriota bacterium]